VRIFGVGTSWGRYVVLPGAYQGYVVEALLTFTRLGDAREVVVDCHPARGLLSLHRAPDFTPILVTIPSAAFYRCETTGGLPARTWASLSCDEHGLREMQLGVVYPFGGWLRCIKLP
jgi:hypothetical protein